MKQQKRKIVKYLTIIIVLLVVILTVLEMSNNESNEDNDKNYLTYETNTKKILEYLEYEQITSIRINKSTHTEEIYELTSNEVIEFFDYFIETELKEVEESYPVDPTPKICYDIYMYNEEGSTMCLMMLENNNFLAFLSIANVIEERERIAGWYEIINTNIDEFLNKIYLNIPE